MDIKFFKKPADFRSWLDRYHNKESELIVGFYKVGSGKQSMTWSESVDQALCYGWIDGIRRSIDEISYQIRFTLRRPNSVWSDVNIRKIEELTSMGLMKPAGKKAFSEMKLEQSRIYAYEKSELELSSEFEEEFKKDVLAWKYFNSLAPSYRKITKNWIMSAKQESTKHKRLLEIIRESGAGTNRWKDNKYNKKKI